MNSGKSQSIIVTGFALIILSGIVLYFALSMPRVTIIDNGEENQELQHTSEYYVSSEQNSQTYIASEAKQNTVTYPLNLNTCTFEDLLTINGIGEKKANDIIEYREYLGSYSDVEQIKNIKGIGDAVFEKLAPYLTV